MADKSGTGADRRKRFEDEALPYLDSLYTMAIRLARNPDDANDLLQETVLRAYRFFHQFESGTNCRVDVESLRADQTGSNPEALASGQRMEGEVEHALAGLPGEFREAILLVDVEELSYQEVSRVLGIPIGTVKSRVSRGRAMLRDALADFAKERGIIRS
jgi:RNA polymerase sigma-70 factor (ECF subfamily)